MRTLQYLVAAMLGAFVFQACSSSGSSNQSTPCNDDPSVCATGTTCWPTDAVPHFACLASDPANGFRASCQDSIGKATCSDGLTCDATGSSSGGTCTYFCNPANPTPCPQGYSCRTTHVGGATGPSIDLCRPGTDVDSGPPPGDSGPPDDGGFVIPDAASDSGPKMP